MKFTGKVWVFGDDLNTDAMYPGFAMKMEPAEAARHIFYEVRPGWTDQVSAGDIVMAGKNFGVGSSRPVAALFAELPGLEVLVPEGKRIQAGRVLLRRLRPRVRLVFLIRSTRSPATISVGLSASR